MEEGEREGEGGNGRPQICALDLPMLQVGQKTAHLQIFTSISPQVVWQHKLDEAEA